ncbi:MAG: YitT family protein [Lachnospiraceae bacterium]
MSTQTNNCQKSWVRYFTLLLGTAILSFGLYNIHSQSQITEGGVLGMTLLLKHWFGISPGISGICLDSLCYFFGYKLLGKAFLKNAIIASLGFSCFYNTYQVFGYVLPDFSNQPLLAAMLGGLFVGVGVGLVVRSGGASGGDDALALIITKLTTCKISKAYLITDLTVLLLSLTYIPMNKIFYSLITVTLSSFIIGRILPSVTSISGLQSNASAEICDTH